MKPEEQRIVIAEACGWTPIGRPDQYDPPTGFPSGALTIAGNQKPLPDYLNSLDAMHEAEKVLMDYCDGWEDYCHKLRRSFMTSDGAIRATAAQRAEAFLRTLNLWTE